MKKLALRIEYDGTMYHGWQKQKTISSVQKHVESAIQKITSESITVTCAGRTDAGVHALGQIIHFETNTQYSLSVWTLGMNSYLPSSICVRWAGLVHQDFHARFSALSRRYYYMIYNHSIRSTFFLGKTWHYKKYLDVSKMLQAAQYLLGENDFSSFRSSGCQSSSSYRKVYYVNVVRKGYRVILIDILANSFVYHMVRNIVGSLVEIGSGKRSNTWILQLLNVGNRSLAGITAPASGLYLVDVKYPDFFSIPNNVIDIFYE